MTTLPPSPAVPTVMEMPSPPTPPSGYPYPYPYPYPSPYPSPSSFPYPPPSPSVGSAPPMYSPSSTSIEIDAGEGKKFLGMHAAAWGRLIVILVILMVVGSLLASFSGMKNSPAFQNLASSFTDATGMLAWATSHWYLIGAALILTPFLTKGSKWAAERLSDAAKVTKDPDVLKAASDAIVHQQKAIDAADESLTPQERQKAAETAAASEESFDESTKSMTDEQKQELDKTSKASGFEIPAKFTARFV